MYNEPRLSAPASTAAGRFLQKALAVAAGTVLLLASLAFSVVVFACLLAAGLVVWARIWWKTRDLRRQLRERAAAHASEPSASRHGGRIIEGEAVRER